MVLFVKLFAIMGLTWFTECVHIVLHDHDHTYSDYCNFYVEASDRYRDSAQFRPIPSLSVFFDGLRFIQTECSEAKVILLYDLFAMTKK